MDRLTQRDITGIPFCQKAGYVDMLKKLASYEDTGLEPEIIRKWAGYIAFVEDASQEYLIELADAEKEGRLIVLPCKVGDTVWSAEPFVDKQIREGHIAQINIDAYGFCGFWASFHPGAIAAEFIKDDIGKTVFLAGEEAEAVLGGDKQ